MSTFDKRKDKMPSSKPGLSFDPNALLLSVAQQKASLDASLALVTKEERELQAALAEKNRTLEAFDKAYAETANLLEGMFLFVGMNELAGKIRPTTAQSSAPTPDGDQ